MSKTDRIKGLVAALCSDECAGRAAGSPGGAVAREHVVSALREAGCDPFEQPVPGCGGANVLAAIEGDTDRWVLVAAHYDHLGTQGADVYHGADDNAAAVAVLSEVARGLATSRQDGRGVLIAAFDAEEPPHFLSDAMGSQHFARHPAVPLDHIDMMVCMDLVGHAVGPNEAPADVRNTLFALGAERSTGTSAIVDATTTAGLSVRRADAEIIPPLSDYEAFWRREVPFLFLTCGRWRHYHTPQDTPEKLSWPKIEATATWLEQYVRATCVADRPRPFTNRRDDAATLSSLAELCDQLSTVSEEASVGANMARALYAACDAQGALPDPRRPEALLLVSMLEQRLA